MTIEKMDKCLKFASGDKKYQVSVTAKSLDFPENLLRGNETEQYVRKCKEQGMTHEEIREAWGKSTSRSVSYAIEVIRKKEDLYDAWIDFWEEIEPVRIMRLDMVCAGNGEIPEDVLKRLEKNGLATVGDFLMACVTVTITDMKKIYVGRMDNKKWIEVKNKIFEKIREQILLTVRMEEE